MHHIMPDQAPSAETPRGLHEICEDARRGQCGYCCAMPGEPCAFSGTGPDGYHVARFAWAEASGLISAADVAEVLEAAGSFTSATVIYDDKRGPAVLPYDQIPAERRTIVDFTGRLGYEGHNGVLGVALAQWMARDDTKAEPEVRQAANTAMDAIDAMLGELHTLRARLVSEIRASDDAAAARAGALLERRRQERAR
jgi:hypothetical protein